MLWKFEGYHPSKNLSKYEDLSRLYFLRGWVFPQVWTST